MNTQYEARTALRALLILLATALPVSLMQGCSHAAVDQKIDQEVAQEAVVKSQADLTQEGSHLIANAAGLTASQKDQLNALKNDLVHQTQDLYLQMLRLRSLLLKDLLTKNYNEDEVELIKQRIKNDEDKRLTLIFEAVERAKTILGKEINSNRHIVEDFMDGGHSTHE